jgi:hypothetical protein
MEISLREDDKRHLVGEFVARGAGGAELLHAIDVPGELGRYDITAPAARR